MVWWFSSIWVLPSSTEPGQSRCEACYCAWSTFSEGIGEGCAVEFMIPVRRRLSILYLVMVCGITG